MVNPVKKLLAVTTSLSMLVTMCLPVSAAPTTLTNASEEGRTTVQAVTTSDNSVSDNESPGSVSKNAVSFNSTWDMLSYSGKQPVPQMAADGNFYTVKGAKFKTGIGSTSSDKRAVKIAGNGVAKAGKAGVAHITSPYGDIDVSVVDPMISTKKLAMAVGSSSQLSVTGIPEGLPVAWLSSNQNAVQVLSGNCVAVGPGKSKVSAYVCGKPFTCTVTVTDTPGSTLLYNAGGPKPVPMKGIKGVKRLTSTISGDSVRVISGKVVATNPAKKVVSGNLSDGHGIWVYANDLSPSNASVSLELGQCVYIMTDNMHGFIDWKSKDPAVATVSEYGILIGNGAGHTTLTAKVNGRKLTVSVSVSETAWKGDRGSGSKRTYQIIDPINGNDGYSVDITENGGYEIIKDSERKVIIPTKPEPTPEKPDIAGLVSKTLEAAGHIDVSAHRKDSCFGKITDFTSTSRDKDGQTYTEAYNGGSYFKVFTQKGKVYFDASVPAGKYVDYCNVSQGKTTCSENELLDEFGSDAVRLEGDTVACLGRCATRDAKANNSPIAPIFDLMTIPEDLDGEVIVEDIQSKEEQAVDEEEDELPDGYHIKSLDEEATLDEVSVQDDTQDTSVKEEKQTKTTYYVHPETNLITRVVVKDENGETTYEIGTDNPFEFGEAGEPEFIESCEDVEPSDLTGFLTATLISDPSDYVQEPDGKYRLTFDPNGGQCDIESTTLAEGEPFGILPMPQKLTQDGKEFIFLGWFTSRTNGRMVDGATQMEARRMTIYAHWAIPDGIKKVELVLNGGKFAKDMENSDFYSSGEEYTLPIPERDGYDFAGWSGTDLDGSNNMEVTIPANAEGNRKYVAHWKVREYILSFDPNGGTSAPASKKVKYGTRFGNLGNPGSYKKDGHTVQFLGWFNEENGGDQVFPATCMDAHDTTLYAHWKETANSYTVVYSANGGSGSINPQVKEYGKDLKLATCTFTAPDVSKTFRGWNTASNGSGTYYSGGATLTKELTAQANARVTLYAIWMQSGLYGDGQALTGWDTLLSNNTFTVINSELKCFNKTAVTGDLYIPNGQGITAIADNAFKDCTGLKHVYIPDDVTEIGDSAFEGCTSLTDITLPSSIDSIGENAFKGCKVQSEAIVIPSDVSTIGDNAFGGLGILAYNGTATGAPWGASHVNPRTIAFNKNGGTGTMARVTKYKNEDLALAVCTFTRSGYVFREWNTKADGSGQAFIDEDVLGDNADAWLKAADSPAVLYAQWDKSYTITYTLNGGTLPDGYTNPTGYTESTDDFTLVNPVKQGMTFTGWTGSNGTTKKTEVTIKRGSTGNKSYKANWDNNSYFIHFDPNGGEGKMDDIMATYNTSRNLTANAFTKPSHSFKGWAMSSTGEKVYNDKASVKNLTSNAGTVITMYAVWERAKYNVRLHKNDGTSASKNIQLECGLDQALPANQFTRAAKGYTYTLKGYSDKPDGSGNFYADGSAVNLTSVPGSTMDLYSQWDVAPLKYTIRYDGNGADSGKVTDQTVEYGQEVTLQNNLFKRGGFTFSGWKCGGKTYKAGDKVKDLASVEGTVIEMVAQWTVNSQIYVVTWENLSAEGSNLSGSAIEDGSTQDASKIGCKRIQYINQSGAVAYINPYISSTSTQQVVIPRGSSLKMVMVSGKSANKDSKVAWYNSDSSKYQSQQTGRECKVISASLTPTADIHLTKHKDTKTADGDREYYNWEVKVSGQTFHYTLKLVSNGSTMSTISMKVGDKYTLPTLTAPAKAGYKGTFEGWFPNADFSGSRATSITMANENKTYYAKYKYVGNPYKLYLNPRGGGKVTSPRTVKCGDKIGALPTPSVYTKAGYTVSFKGWYTAASGGTKVTENTTMWPTDKTIYAQWNEVSQLRALTFRTQYGTAPAARLIAVGSTLGALPQLPEYITREEGGRHRRNGAEYVYVMSHTGWRDKATGATVTRYTTMPSGGMTLEAIWSERERLRRI